MTGLIAITVACALMALGHYFKTKRWKLLFRIYEEPNEGVLLRSLALGHALNALLPIRIGDAVRVYVAGKKTKNGLSFSLATVIADLYVDILTVGLMFAGLFFVGKGGGKLQAVSRQYAVIFAILIPLTLLAIAFKRSVKRVVKAIASIFNDKINFRILYVTYLCIASIKDIVRKISKVRFVIYTILMWLMYCGSYWFFAEGMQIRGLTNTMSEVFVALFSGAVIYRVLGVERVYWLVYLIMPLLVCLGISFIVRRPAKEEYFRVIPYLSRSDRFSFLKMYFENENRDYLSSYLSLNRDITVVEDKTKGSDASTVLAIKQDGSLCYRKYAFGDAGKKLIEQEKWINNNRGRLSLPDIVGEKEDVNFASYDMPQISGADSFFNYIHSMPIDKSFALLSEIFDDLNKNLYVNPKPVDDIDIREYIQKKVLDNKEYIIKNDSYIRNIEQFESVEVNGKKLRTLHTYDNILNYEFLSEVFKNDFSTEIHGDLTVENVVCTLGHETKKHNYYLIDPNFGNIVNSPFLDYAKMLQSLHGNYEFYMMVESISIEKDRVKFSFFPSEAYTELYEKFDSYIREKYSTSEVRSIYFHEIIHWLRLMPYKIKRDERMAVVFYIGLLSVLDDVRKFVNER